MKYFDNSICSNPGTDVIIEYSPVVKEDGSITLEESGKSNIQEYIDSFEESCSLENIIARYENGDLSALNVGNPKFGDFTEFPKTYAEVLQLQIDSNNLFNSLPKEIKQKFDNDANKFFVMSGSEEWFEIIKPLYDKNDIVKNDVESEVEVKE